MRDQERVVRAVEYLNGERAARPGIPLVQLVDEAARHFDLDAAQSEWLLRSALETRPKAASLPDGPAAQEDPSGQGGEG